MADIIDQAQEQEAMNIANSLRIHAERAQSVNKPKAAGYCLNHECGEPFGASTERLFCGPICAQRFDVIQRIKHQ
jgi:hypothetical protein